jgi:hypothetical protein
METNVAFVLVIISKRLTTKYTTYNKVILQQISLHAVHSVCTKRVGSFGGWLSGMGMGTCTFTVGPLDIFNLYQQALKQIRSGVLYKKGLQISAGDSSGTWSVTGWHAYVKR